MFCAIELLLPLFAPSKPEREGAREKRKGTKNKTTTEIQQREQRKKTPTNHDENVYGLFRFGRRRCAYSLCPASAYRFFQSSVDHFLPSKKDVNASYAAAERFVFPISCESEKKTIFLLFCFCFGCMCVSVSFAKNQQPNTIIIFFSVV